MPLKLGRSSAISLSFVSVAAGLGRRWRSRSPAAARPGLAGETWRLQLVAPKARYSAADSTDAATFHRRWFRVKTFAVLLRRITEVLAQIYQAVVLRAPAVGDAGRWFDIKGLLSIELDQLGLSFRTSMPYAGAITARLAKGAAGPQNNLPDHFNFAARAVQAQAFSAGHASSTRRPHAADPPAGRHHTVSDGGRASARVHWYQTSLQANQRNRLRPMSPLVGSGLAAPSRAIWRCNAAVDGSNGGFGATGYNNCVRAARRTPR